MVSDVTPAAAAPATRTSAEGSVHATWVYTLGSIVFFFLVLDGVLLIRGLSALSRSHSSIDVLIVVFTLASTIVQVRFCWFLREGLGGGLPHTAWTATLFAASVPALVLGLFSPDLWHVAPLPLWLSVVLVACLLPERTRWNVLGAGVAITIGSYLLAKATLPSTVDTALGDRDIAIFLFAAFMPVAVILSLWWWNIVIELDRHRRSAAELAIAKERLRFAADLHDIQGHHLQVIALKAELAERMLQRDPAAAREQLRETRLIASEALQETRSLVAGYREVGLDDELENAREVLSAAGAACELRIRALPASATARRALAYVVREATTNIIRHSSASTVTISVESDGGCYRLTISNDGVDPASAVDASGTGLDGLRTRVENQGGTFATTLDAGRFELIATIPDNTVSEGSTRV